MERNPLVMDMVHWIAERYAIKMRKDAGAPPPWSPDGVFQTVRFCNVHREDDKVTKWIRYHWNRGYDPAWRFVLARMINLTESLDEIVGVDDLESVSLILKARRAKKKKVFTSAYTISTCGRQMDKIDYVLGVVRTVRIMAPTVFETTCRGTWTQLQTVDGLGSFLAAQVVADMKNTAGHPLEHAQDWWTFSAPGPGSLRGLSWFWLGQPQGITASRYAAALRECRALVDPLVPEYVPRISDQDFQNCLCEFSKYCNVKYNNGHVRNRYDVHAAS